MKLFLQNLSDYTAKQKNDYYFLSKKNDFFLLLYNTLSVPEYKIF